MRFSVLHRALRKRVDDCLREEGLTGAQLFVLARLRALELSGTSEVNQRDLENASHVTHPTMTGIIQRLESKGYIVCSQSVHDRRYKAIASTGKALGLRQRMDEIDALTFRELCRGLSQEQIDKFIEITDIMTDNAIKSLKGSERISDKKAGTVPERI